MTAPEHTTLKTAYADKVSADLADNTAEQERIRAEIDALQGRLTTLEADHALLEGVRAALGDTGGAVPAPRRATRKTAKESAKKATTDGAVAKKATTDGAVAKKPATDGVAAKKPATDGAVAKKTTGKKSPAGRTAQAARKTAAKNGGAKGPALADLIAAHLKAQSEPRTAREITAALTDANPGRNINNNLVRTTTERLVARSRADRVKQGSTVYYTATEAQATPAAAPESVDAAAAAAS